MFTQNIMSQVPFVHIATRHLRKNAELLGPMLIGMLRQLSTLLSLGWQFVGQGLSMFAVDTPHSIPGHRSRRLARLACTSARTHATFVLFIHATPLTRRPVANYAITNYIVFCGGCAQSIVTI